MKFSLHLEYIKEVIDHSENNHKSFKTTEWLKDVMPRLIKHPP